MIAASLLLAGCSANQPADDTPAGVLKRYTEASQKQDVATMKSLLSKGSIEMLETSAKDEKLTADDILRKEAAVPIKKMPETRNEKIEGDRATLEVTNDVTGQFETYYFVRENGAWKLARDKYVEEIRRVYEESGRSKPHSAPMTLNRNASANSSSAANSKTSNTNAANK